VELVLIWAPDRATFIDGMLKAGFATLDEDGNPIWHPEAQVDEIGPITTYGEASTPGEDPPSVTVTGHHVNLRGWGELTEMLSAGLPQTNADGSLKSLLVERTRILTVVPGCEWEKLPNKGVPSGYKGPHGVVLIDPAAVKTPHRVWA
jgi:hypothetical protein